MKTDDGSSRSNHALERHRALVAAFEGQQPMGWREWKLPFHEENALLTPTGREAALWAADVLAGFLRADFPNAVWRPWRQGKDESPHLLFVGLLWPGAN